jgi:hypothetical protein
LSLFFGRLLLLFLLFLLIFPSGTRLWPGDDPGDVRVYSIHAGCFFLRAVALGSFFSLGLSPLLSLALSLAFDN